jgi:hypothetical protein
VTDSPHSSGAPPPQPLTDEEATGVPPGPPGQDTIIVTDLASDSKTTRAVVAGPRVTFEAS